MPAIAIAAAAETKGKDQTHTHPLTHHLQMDSAAAAAAAHAAAAIAGPVPGKERKEDEGWGDTFLARGELPETREKGMNFDCLRFHALPYTGLPRALPSMGHARFPNL